MEENGEFMEKLKGTFASDLLQVLRETSEVKLLRHLRLLFSFAHVSSFDISIGIVFMSSFD